MGFALFAFATLSRPLRRLRRWGLAARHMSRGAAPSACTTHGRTDALHGATPNAGPPDSPAVAGMAQEIPARHRAFAMPAADAATQQTGLRPAISTRSLPLRVILRHDTDDACKLVISGRMADVCAELERLALR